MKTGKFNLLRFYVNGENGLQLTNLDLFNFIYNKCKQKLTRFDNTRWISSLCEVTVYESDTRITEIRNGIERETFSVHAKKDNNTIEIQIFNDTLFNKLRLEGLPTLVSKDGYHRWLHYFTEVSFYEV